MYQVYQDGNPCSSYVFKGWGKDKFKNLDEAIVFMFKWAYPYDTDTAKGAASHMFGIGYSSFEMGTEYNLSMLEIPCMMSIIHVDEVEIEEYLENRQPTRESNYLRYKGYLGSIEVSIVDDVIFGKLLDINDLVTYESNDIQGIKESFKEAVDDYISFCENN